VPDWQNEPGTHHCDILFAGKPTSETFQFAPRQRAKRYRELAQDARAQAARSKGAAQAAAFAKIAQHWEQLARETDKRSLTWDRGLEMAKHPQFTVATNVKVYFCDPQSP